MPKENSIKNQGFQKITFVTDIRSASEPDILKAVLYENLRILALDDTTITTSPAPQEGWTHALLTNEADKVSAKTSFGANAYLGGTWVGSTEV